MTSIRPRQDVADLVRTSLRFGQARSKLLAYKARKWRLLDDSAKQSLERTRDQAAKGGDEVLAKAAWVLLNIARAQNDYVSAVDSIRNSKYYAAWCSLEQCEQRIHELAYHFTETKNEFGLEFMRRQVSAFQGLYPYGMFISPEFVYKRILCGICSAPITVRNKCGHQKWEVYGGTMMYHRIEDVEFVGAAIVMHPVQKYSVLGAVGEDDDLRYNHTYVDYVVKGLRSPWNGWTAHKTTQRHPHSHFSNHPAEGPCPCEGSKTYAECCLKESGVLRPHLMVRFDEPPPAGLPPLRYSNPGKT